MGTPGAGLGRRSGGVALGSCDIQGAGVLGTAALRGLGRLRWAVVALGAGARGRRPGTQLGLEEEVTLAVETTGEPAGRQGASRVGPALWARPGPRVTGWSCGSCAHLLPGGPSPAVGGPFLLTNQVWRTGASICLLAGTRGHSCPWEWGAGPSQLGPVGVCSRGPSLPPLRPSPQSLPRTLITCRGGVAVGGRVPVATESMCGLEGPVNQQGTLVWGGAWLGQGCPAGLVQGLPLTPPIPNTTSLPGGPSRPPF